MKKQSALTSCAVSCRGSQCNFALMAPFVFAFSKQLALPWRAVCCFMKDRQAGTAAEESRGILLCHMFSK